jgi:hypothetical protein
LVSPPRGFWASIAQEQAEELLSLRAQQSPHNTCQGKEQCQVRVQDRSNANVVFTCWACNRKVHWACAGYDRAALSSLPVIVCPRCLTSQGKSPATCALAAINRRLLLEHVTTTLKRTIQRIPADGWCLIRAVAEAVGKSKNDLLEAALHSLKDMLPHLQIDDDERAKVASDCEKLLSQPAARRQMRRQWDSALFVAASVAGQHGRAPPTHPAGAQR